MEKNYFDLIPATYRPAVEAALVKTFGSALIQRVEPLSGGLSGSMVFKLLMDGHAYVLKWDVHPKPSEALALASRAGIAPRVYFQDAGITIADFIENVPVWNAFEPGKRTTELAKTIRSVHGIPFHTQTTPLKDIINAGISDFLKAGLLGGPVIEECISFYEVLKLRYPWDDPDKVFSHNDINPGNLLCDGTRLWLIDWDTAAVNDRYVDLAIVANFFAQTAEQESELLRVYFDGSVDEYKKARFYLMRQIARIFYGIRLVQVAAQNKPAGRSLDQQMEGNTLKILGELMTAGKISLATYEGQLMCGKAQLNEALHHMRSPQFADALDQLRPFRSY